MRSKPRHRAPITLLALLLAAALGFAGCSTKSPSEPKQTPPPPPGTSGGSATFNIVLTASPPTLPAEGQDPSVITISVHRADNGQAPVNGTTIVATTTAGDFQSLASGVQSVVLSLFNGQAQVELFPTQRETTATVRAQLDNSIGEIRIPIAVAQSFFIDSISPISGNPQGGETVVIKGSGFVAPVRVEFQTTGGANNQSGKTTAQVISATSDEIDIVTPPAPTTVQVGDKLITDVVVTIRFGRANEESQTLQGGFVYVLGGSLVEPVITGVSPTTGSNDGGTRVVITGDGFEAPIQVLFGTGGDVQSFDGIEAAVESVSRNRLVVRTPPATGFGQDNRNQLVDILVRNVASGTAAVAANAFRYGVKVLITSISPGEGPFTGGTLVTVFGQGFDDPVAVEMGGVAQQIVSVTGTEIVIRTVPVEVTNCQEPSGPTKVVNIDTGDGADNGPVFTYRVPDPIITGAVPSSGPESGNTQVTITGLNFQNPLRVLFGDQAASVQSVSSNGTQIVVKTPPFSGTLPEKSCDDNGDGTQGMKFIPASVSISVSNLVTGCDDSFNGAFSYTPSDTSCRGDTAPTPPVTQPQCSDGIDNDGDGLVDFPNDPQCTDPSDNNEAM